MSRLEDRFLFRHGVVGFLKCQASAVASLPPSPSVLCNDELCVSDDSKASACLLTVLKLLFLGEGVRCQIRSSPDIWPLIDTRDPALDLLDATVATNFDREAEVPGLCSE